MVQRSFELTEVDAIELGDRAVEVMEQQDAQERLMIAQASARLAVAESVSVDAA
jgi:hypothetical protein